MGSNGSTRHPYDELPCIVSISSQSKKCVRCCILELACFNGVVWKTSTDLTFPDGTIGKAHLKLRGARAHSRNADTEGADQVLQDDGSASLGGAVAATADSEADDPVMTIDLEGALPTGAMKVEGGVADGSMVASASGTTQDPIAEGEEVDMEGDESMVTAEGEESMVAAADNIVEDGYEPRSETGLSEDVSSSA